jgi:fructokinase
MSFTVIGIGEVLWDLLPTGPQLGGAPVNFTCHIGALGGNALAIARIGKDDFGRATLARLDEVQVPRDTIQIDDDFPTGTVAITLSAQGVPKYTFAENTAWDRLAATHSALQAVKSADAVCFGTLGQRSSVSREAIRQLLKEAPAEALRIFDINLRQHFYSKEIIEESLGLANILKLNDEELVVLKDMFSLQGDVRQQIQQLAQAYGLQVVVLTCGARGSLIYKEREWSEQQSKPVEVVDTVGAGDAFTAALTMGLLNKMSLGKLHLIAEEVARYVCTQPGAMPSLPEAFRKKIA